MPGLSGMTASDQAGSRAHGVTIAAALRETNKTASTMSVEGFGEAGGNNAITSTTTPTAQKGTIRLSTPGVAERSQPLGAQPGERSRPRPTPRLPRLSRHSTGRSGFRTALRRHGISFPLLSAGTRDCRAPVDLVTLRTQKPTCP